MKTVAKMLMDIETLISKQGIKIIYEINNRCESIYGSYLYTEREIIVKRAADFRTSSVEILCVLAHELGHHFDDLDQLSLGRKDWIRAYMSHGLISPKDRAKKMLREDKYEVYNREVAAWDYAKITLARLGFGYWDHFDESRSRRLDVYLELLGMR